MSLGVPIKEPRPRLYDVYLAPSDFKVVDVAALCPSLTLWTIHIDNVVILVLFKRVSVWSMHVASSNEEQVVHGQNRNSVENLW